MKITKEHLKAILKKYMIENKLGYVSMEVSLSIDQSKVIMAITEEEEDIDDSYLYN